MYCEHCGYEIDDDSLFCDNCGKRVEPLSAAPPVFSEPQPVLAQNPEPASVPAVSALPQKSSGKKTAVIISAVCAVILLAVAAVFVLFSVNRVNVGKYIADDIAFSGTNGYASIENVYNAVNYNELIDSLGKKAAPSDFQQADDIAIYNCFNISFDKNKELSNGDKVTATVTVNYNLLNSMNYNKKAYGKKQYVKEYVVSGLTDATVINPYNFIKEVAYVESDNEAYIRYNPLENHYGIYTVKYVNEGNNAAHFEIKDNTGKTAGSFSFELDKSNYSSTNKITVSVLTDGDELNNSGVMLEPVQKELIPSVCRIASDPTVINVSSFNEIKKAVLKKAEERYGEVIFVDSYFLYRKDASAPYENRLAFVVKALGEFIPFYLNDILVNDRGEIVIEDSIEVSEGGKYSASNSIINNFLNDYEVRKLKAK